MVQRPTITPADVQAALANLVLPEETVELAGLAVSSGRSLFVFGPPGNGKTSLGRQLHHVQQGTQWIPYCIGIENQVIQVFDPQCHEEVPLPKEELWAIDQRWVRIRRPMVVVGGEATLDSFDLSYSPALRYYEAPLHLKANGGTFLIDDFGRQRVEPHQLLNRWIIPLEHQIDYMTLRTAQKIQVPFRLMLILATNLDPERVMDPAFLRRMGYRLFLGQPTPERYVDIFEQYAARRNMEVTPGLVQRLLARYHTEGRELRCCEPRDLLERVCDICRFRSFPVTLTEEMLNLAWIGYFGNQSPSHDR